jgi:AcrR family transcriptional regulator
MTRRRHAHEQERPDREARHAAKRQQLLDAAIAVVRREGPAASMEDIAREAGITKPIVYRAFGDRDGLTRAVADLFAAELRESLAKAIEDAPDDRGRVSAAIDAYVSFIEREPSIMRFLVHRGLDGDRAIAMSDFVRSVAAIITQALGEGLRERRLDSGAAEPWAYAIVGAVHLAGDWWLERKTLSRERVVEYLTSLVWDGMRNFAPRGKS